MEYLFAYGQFRDVGIPLLKDAINCGRSSVKGKMYKVNNFYPGLVDGDNNIIGNIYQIDPNILPDLDEFEGDEYIRTKIVTSSNIECWVYKYKNDIKSFEEVKSGDWWLRK